MATASSLISDALRKIGVIASGETPAASESADALTALNDIIEEWSTDGYLIYEKKRETFDLTPGTGTYTVGVDGDLDTARPQVILEATIQQTDQDAELPLRNYNIQEWARVALKNTQSDLPTGIYYNAAYPFGELTFYPVPSQAVKFNLYSLKPLTSIASLATELTMPPGYNRALKLALSIELASEYGKEVSAKMLDDADKAKAKLMRGNVAPVYLTSDAVGLDGNRAFNILTGE